jgi:hypothetical protein
MDLALSEEDISKAWACAEEKSARTKLLKLANFPPDILSRIATRDRYTIDLNPKRKTTNREIQLARQHPNLPGKSISSYFRKASQARKDSQQFEQLCTDFFLNPNFPAELIPTLYSTSKGTEFISSNLRCIVNNPKCSPAVLQAAFDCGDRQVHQALAYNPALPRHLVVALLESQDQLLQGIIVRNKNIPTDLIYDVIKEWPKINGYLLGRLIKRMPEGKMRLEAVLLLNSLSKSTYSRIIIAEYFEDPGVLVGLSLDSNRNVRKAVLRNPATPEEGLVAATLIDSPLIGIC